jgi:hypothetical protein
MFNVVVAMVSETNSHLPASGENSLELSIVGAVLNESVASAKFNDQFATFAYVDFYEFGTAVTPLGIGIKPLYNHMIKYLFFK